MSPPSSRQLIMPYTIILYYYKVDAIESSNFMKLFLSKQIYISSFFTNSRVSYILVMSLVVLDTIQTRYDLCAADQIIAVSQINDMSRLSRREQLASHLQDDKEEAVDYRQLYLDCKKNVALFMQHVDSELSTILSNHEKEKNALKSQVQRLKLQLRQQEVPQVQPVYTTRTPAHHRRNSSDCRSNNQETFAKQIVENISQLHNFDARSLCSDKKEATDCSFNEERRVSFRLNEEEKQNFVLTGNLETQSDVPALKGVPSARRERFREKKPLEAIQKADNIKDLLKGIRGKFSNNQSNEQSAPCVNIISPGMFSARN